MSTLLQNISSKAERTQLTPEDIEVCFCYAANHFQDHVLDSVAQGGCSYTLKVKPKTDNCRPTIVQFRLPTYALSLDKAVTASGLYSTLAPKTHEIGSVGIRDETTLQVLSMSCVPGVRLSDVQPRTRGLDKNDFIRMQVVVQSFAVFFARQWSGGETHIPTLSGCTGKVGSSLLDRLRELERRLPGSRLRQRAGVIRREAEEGLLDGLPVVLTHGDLLPSNIMVDAASFEIKGYVDWAEAEYLPFGVSLYGLEHLLGYLEIDSATKKSSFIYYAKAEELRALFWRALRTHIDEINSDVVRHATETAAQIGILLWHGFAWDDGKIDRVVDREHDAVEMEYLHKFLNFQAEPQRRDSAIVDTPAARSE